MKQQEKLYDAVTGVREELVVEAGAHKFKGRHKYARRWCASIAAVLAIVIALSVIVRPGGTPVTAYAIAEAEYPEMAPYPDESARDFDAQFDAWWEDIRAQRQGAGYSDGLEDFWSSSLQAFLGNANGENKVCSPVNIYMALGMLCELTDGESRQQILEALGCGSIGEVRAQAKRVWNANYRNDGATTSILASSLWLNEDVSFRQSTLDALAGNYYASTYQGAMGSEALNLALQNWLNTQTNGLLEDQIRDIELSAETVMALATTVAFQAKWSNEFNSSRTEEGVFHGAAGDTTVEYMHQSPDTNYYWGDQFAAVSRALQNCNGHMWFILPDEGVTPEELLADEEVLDFIVSDGESGESKFLIVNQSIPKFDVSSQMELEDGMTALGITDVFDASVSDFSPMTDAVAGIYLAQTTHGARVAIDEEGVTAAAYTVMAEAGAGEPPTDEVDFVLDRPFLFVITGADGEPLFVGIVNQI